MTSTPIAPVEEPTEPEVIETVEVPETPEEKKRRKRIVDTFCFATRWLNVYGVRSFFIKKTVVIPISNRDKKAISLFCDFAKTNHVCHYGTVTR